MSSRRPHNKVDWESYIGCKFNRLTVLRVAGKNKFGHPLFECRCDCGTVVLRESTRVKNGASKSCGCYQIEITSQNNSTHRLSKTRLYHIWGCMIQRCNNPKNSSYKFYGPKHVSVCPEWRNDFMEFYNWAISNGYREDLTIDRIDGNKDYCPDNCRWVDAYVQSNNRSNNRLMTLNGITKNCKQWSNYFGFNYKYFHQKCSQNNWDLEKVLEIPYFKNQIKGGAISCL